MSSALPFTAALAAFDCRTLSRRTKRRVVPPQPPDAADSGLLDPDAFAMIVRILNGELDGPGLVALRAATRRRIDELLTARRFPAPLPE